MNLSFEKFCLLFGDENRNNKSILFKAYMAGYVSVYGCNSNGKPNPFKFEREVFGRLRLVLGDEFHSKERWEADRSNVRDGEARSETYQMLIYGLYVNVDETAFGKKCAAGLDAAFSHLFERTFEQRCDDLKHILETSEEPRARLRASARGRTHSVKDLSVKVGIEERDDDPASSDFLNLYLRLVLEPFGGVDAYVFGFSELLVLIKNESEGALAVRFNRSDWGQDGLKWCEADIGFSGLTEDNAQLKLSNSGTIVTGKDEFSKHLFTVHSFDSTKNYPPNISVTLFGNTSEATLRKKNNSSTGKLWDNVNTDLREKFIKRVILKHRLHRHIDEPWLELANQTVTVSLDDLEGLF